MVYTSMVYLDFKNNCGFVVDYAVIIHLKLLGPIFRPLDLVMITCFQFRIY